MIKTCGAWKGVVLFLAIFASRLGASVLQLDYDVLPESGGEYHYDFTLILTNADGVWSPGNGFNGIEFGIYQTASGSGPGFGSPLTGFLIDSVPPPFQYGTTTIGCCASGVPTLIEVGYTSNGGWPPSAVGDVLTWSGSADVNIPQGDLYWDYIFGLDNQLAVADEVAPSVPEPTLIIGDGIMVGLFAVLALRRRRAQSS